MTQIFENTAPRRRGAVDADDFRACYARRHRLTFGFNEAARPDAGTLYAWNRFIPLTPAAAVKILTRDLPPRMQVSFTMLEDEGDGEISLHRTDPRGHDYQIHNSRIFNLGTGTIMHGDVHVAPHMQERSYGRITMRNQIEFFHACGADRFVIHASSENGGYSWARMGFLPHVPQDIKYRYKSMISARERFRVLEPVLTRDEAARIEKLMEQRQPEDMWALADMRRDMVPALRETFNRRSHISLEQDHRMELRAELGEAFDRAVTKKQALPLGRLLLSGTSWNGVLDLNNRAQMERAGAYCGGWKYIKM